MTTDDRAPGRYRKIQVRLWSDEKFRTLSPIPPCGAGLWFFLLTGPHTGPIPGLFRAGRASMAEELGWEVEAFDEAFKEVSAQGMAKADFKARLVWLPKAIDNNRPESPNVIRGWGGEFDLLPECALKNEALAVLATYVSSMGEGFVKAFEETFGKAIRKASAKASVKGMANQEQEQEQEQKQDKNLLSGQSPDGGKKIEKTGKKFTGSEEDFTAARWMFDLVRKVNPAAKEPRFDSWANDVRLMRELDGRTHKEICELFQWAKKDAFWCANIQSPAKLREKWDTLVERRMQKPAQGSVAAPQQGQASLDAIRQANNEEAKRLLFGNKNDGEVIDA